MKDYKILKLNKEEIEVIKEVLIKERVDFLI